MDPKDLDCCCCEDEEDDIFRRGDTDLEDVEKWRRDDVAFAGEYRVVEEEAADDVEQQRRQDEVDCFCTIRDIVRNAEAEGTAVTAAAAADDAMVI